MARGDRHGASKNDMTAGQNFQAIVGEKLSAVVFILDYWQFQFDGPSISALTRIEVCEAAATTRDGDDQFRNRLCSLIGKIVGRVSFNSDALTVTFTDETSLSISLRWADYRGPEAAIFHSADQKTISVIRADDSLSN
jgi:hypothetical protein